MVRSLYRYAVRNRRSGPTLVLLLLILVLHNAPGSPTRVTQAASADKGLATSVLNHNGRTLIRLYSPERFVLEVDETGIVVWHALAIDPQGHKNLVTSGRRLVEHYLADGTAVTGALTLVEQSPVRSQIAWYGQSGGKKTAIVYSVWVGGQIVIHTSGPAGISSTVHAASGSIAGVTLQEQATVVTEGYEERSFLLFLDSWSGESKISVGETAGLAGVDAAGNIIRSVATPGQPLMINLPHTAGLRQPRFEIADWPAETLSIHRGETLLVNGQDYLAHWDSVTQLLSVQYLHILPAGDPVGHSFKFSATPAAPSIALTIFGRPVDENGLLIIDGNMPAFNRTETISDVFKIPYIQSANTFTAAVVAQEAPADASVEFVLEGFPPVRDLAPPFEYTFTIKRYGEYRLDAFLLDSAGNRIANDTINPVGYGHIIVSIGDSITAGQAGDVITATGQLTYPVVTATDSPAFSKDKRNFYQYANYDVSNGAYYRGYQVSLNGLLTECTSGVPIFILNDGFPGMYTWGDPNTSAGSRLGAAAKIDAFNRHIKALDARYIIIGLGTNDVTRNLSVTTWLRHIASLVQALQPAGGPLDIWFARVPWRPNEAPMTNSTQTRTELYSERLTPLALTSYSTFTQTVRIGPDFYTYFKDNPTLIADNVHPTKEGLEGMALLWSQYICNALPNRNSFSTIYLPVALN